MIKISHLATLLLFFVFSHSALSQSYLKAEGKVITNEEGDTILLRGMGLGGWMVQEGYMLQTSEFASPQWQIRETIEDLVGEEETNLFYESWLQNHVTKTDIDSLKSWGFNHVRLPMHYNLFTLPIQDEPIAGENTWIEKGFELTDSLISWCAQNEMYVILDLHAAPGGQGYAQEISDYNPAYPSLWESNENKNKTVDLWRRIAERYKDQPWVGAYDLINEPNWDLPGGTALRNLYIDITDAIREVDTKHLIIIEGNWFANDFTGLNNPWDSNMAYGPHKYWSFNNPNDNNWLIQLRDDNNVPIYLGESGENSNVWFRDAIKLLEDEGFGWAWWPEKKVESISGPLSMQKGTRYQQLLDYWSGNAPQPSNTNAILGLQELSQSAKLQNCVYQKDVIDAMFRQVQTNETLPFSDHIIPGIIHLSDYDLGTNGYAYLDQGTATYHVTTGEFTAWNNGWQYRNDGVDIERCQDNINTNGYNVGWVEEGEWMKYTVDVLEEGLYDVILRVAASGTNAAFTIASGNTDLTRTYFVPNSNGFQNWQTVTISDIVLTPDDKSIYFKSLGTGANYNSLEFIKVGESNEVSTVFTSAETIDENSISVGISKPLASPINVSNNDFKVTINGNNIPITSIELDPNNHRAAILNVDFVMKYGHFIKVSYDGIQLEAFDNTLVNNFDQENVLNTLPFFHPIPGKVEAEDFTFQSGIQLEDCSDEGGGQNIGYLDVGDYMDYRVRINQSGIYTINYRTASESAGGGIAITLIDDQENVIPVNQAYFSATGGWQNWTTTSYNTQIPAGSYTMRLTVIESQFNLNYLEFKSITSTDDLESLSYVVFPNPTSDKLYLKGLEKNSLPTKGTILDINGKVIYSAVIRDQDFIDLSNVLSGMYILRLEKEGFRPLQQKIIKL